MEQFGGECLDVAFGYPRCPEIGVDVAGQHVLGLYGSQCLDIAGIGRSSLLGGGELGLHIAREIVIGRFPFPGLAGSGKSDRPVRQ